MQVVVTENVMSNCSTNSKSQKTVQNICRTYRIHSNWMVRKNYIYVVMFSFFIRHILITFPNADIVYLCHQTYNQSLNIVLYGIFCGPL